MKKIRKIIVNCIKQVLECVFGCIKKYPWYIVIGLLLCVFIMPFIVVSLCGKDCIFTFGLDNLKDFYTLWVAMFGAIGITINIIHNQMRIRQQEKQGRDSRFAKSVELLGHESESARMGAVYNLFFLVKEFPDEYGKVVSTILCSHIRTITGSLEYRDKFETKPSNEVQSILTLLLQDCPKFYPVDLSDSYLAGIHLENARLYNSDLSGCNLSGSLLLDCDLNHTLLFYVNFAHAKIHGSDLSYTNMSHTNMSHTNLSHSNLSCANMFSTDLSTSILYRAYFFEVRLTMEQQKMIMKGGGIYIKPYNMEAKEKV